MIDFPYIGEICRRTDSKIVMLVVDGLGGVPHPETGLSELETASLPNLDRLAQESAAGLTTPVGPGITPGSGPGHMALFGYDPVKYLMGRGVLEALGIGVELRDGDVAARGNLCTVDAGGVLLDRRAGRIPSEESAPVVKRLAQIEVPGVDVSVQMVKEHRFVMVLRGSRLGEAVSETDPQVEGVPALKATALTPDSERTAVAANRFVEGARAALRERKTANMVLLRGFSRLPRLPDMGKAYKLKPAAVAAYPMYRGLGKIVGMEVLATGATFDDEIETLRTRLHEHDFFFLHYKPADAAGEDGDFDAKVRALEELDTRIPQLVDAAPDVLVVAGDHASPAIVAGHSWHPVPLLVRSRLTKGDGVSAFSERACGLGSLGHLPATSVMFIALAHAGKLHKFGP